MRSRALVDLRNDCLFLLDLQGAKTPAVGDLNERLNQGIAEVFSIFVRNSGGEDSVFNATATVPLTLGTTVYPLPANFYELVSCEIALGTGDVIVLTQFSLVERPYLASSTPGWSGEPLKYRIEGKSSYADAGSIEFLPAPASNLTITLRYVWCPTRLVNDTDTFDGIAGFEDFAVLHAVYRCAIRYKQYALADRMQAEMARVKETVIALAKGRDAFMPPKVQMTRELWRPRFTRSGRGW